MGMYAELVLKADIQNPLPPLVEAVLKFLFNGETEPAELPDHAFFKCPRWRMIGKGNSFYHIPWAESLYSEDRIFSRSDLKNYNREIELFIEWLKPYIALPEGHCIGWSWYEEEYAPTLLYR